MLLQKTILAWVMKRRIKSYLAWIQKNGRCVEIYYYESSYILLPFVQKQDHYAVLGLSHLRYNATAEQIKIAREFNAFIMLLVPW